MTTSKNAPVDHVRFGGIQAAIWRNDTENGPRYSVTVDRRYFDEKEQKWKSTSSFNRDDLPLVGKAVDLAHTKIYELQSADRAASRQDGSADQADASETQSPPPAQAAGGASASDSSTPTRAARAKSRSGAGR